MIPTVDNIISVYRRASIEQYMEGREWYASTNAFARTLSSDIHEAAGVIAALSPITDWPRNQYLAQRAYDEGRLTGGTLGSSVEKANRILDGEHPEIVLGANEKSQKTLNFYRNIVDPYGYPVTIDRHAFDIAVGMPTDDAARRILMRKGVYNTFADVYRAAAALFNLPAPAMQAITWTVWREEKGIA